MSCLTTPHPRPPRGRRLRLALLALLLTACLDTAPGPPGGTPVPGGNGAHPELTGAAVDTAVVQLRATLNALQTPLASPEAAAPTMTATPPARP